jgi:serine protease Do
MLAKTSHALICFVGIASIYQIPMAVALSPQEVAQAIKPLVVRIITKQGSASGTLIKREGNTYQVLTIAAASKGDSITIVTADGQRHLAKKSQLSGSETALLTFASSKEYKVAIIVAGPSFIGGNSIFIAGFPKVTRTITAPVYTFRPATLERQSSTGGLAYKASLLPGMEGGGIFDSSAKLIGIHSRRVSGSSRQDQVNGNIQFQSGTYTGIPIAAFISASQSAGTGSYDSNLITGNSGSSGAPSAEQIEAIRTSMTGTARDGGLLFEAQAKIQQGQYREAIALYDAYIQKHPKEALAYSGRGNAKFGMGDKKGAIADYDKALQMYPRPTGIVLYRGIAKAQSGDLNGGIIDLQQAVVENPTSPESHYYLALGLYERGDKAVAIASMKKAQSLYETQGNKAKAQELEQLLRRMK